MVRLYEVSPFIVDECLEKLAEDSISSKSLFPDLRKQAHKRKLERELFEQYGHYKHIVLDPRFQFVKNYLEENSDLSVFGDQYMPVSTILIIIFIIGSRLQWTTTSLITLFLLNLNPIYVSFFILAYWIQRKQRKNGKKVSLNLGKCKAASIEATEFDHVFIGSDMGTYYTAALLSKIGQSCCIIEPHSLQKLEVFPDGAPCAAPIMQAFVTNPERYQVRNLYALVSELLYLQQALLDAVICSESERTKLVPLSNESEGFANAFLAINDNCSSNLQRCTICSRSGEDLFLSDICFLLRMDKSVVRKFWDEIKAKCQNFTTFLMKKAVPLSLWNSTNISNSMEVKQIEDFLASSIEKICVNGGINDKNFTAFLTAISSTFGISENLPATSISAIALGNLISAVENGLYIPDCSVFEIKKRLLCTITHNGGLVVSNVSNSRLVLDQIASENYKAIGIAIVSNGKEKLISGRKSVVSGLGMLSTFSNLVPLQCLKPATINQLSLLTEARPKLKVIFWLHGTSDSLQLSCADYFEVERIHEQHRESHTHAWSPSAQDPTWCNRHPENISIIIVELEVLEPLVTPQQWEVPNLVSVGNPTFYVSPAIKQSSPNQSQFTNEFGRSLTLSAENRNRFTKLAENVMKRIYPLTAEKILLSHVEPPILGGHCLANNMSKYACQLGAATDIENFYLTGRDISTCNFMGDLQSGWISANSILGFSLDDLQNNRNVLTQIMT